MSHTELRPRQMKLDFLYLDLTSCDRCIGTGSSVDRAVALLSPVLGEIGVQLDVHKTLVGSEDQARRLGLVSSPTILVDGYDIAGELRQSACKPCGCDCEGGVDCRVWVYNGQEYDEAPVGLIVEAALGAAYGRAEGDRLVRHERLNENLERYFAGKGTDTATACCEDPALCCVS